MTLGGNAQDGYFLLFECYLYFHGSSLERLLSLVLSKTEIRGTIIDKIRYFENIEQPQPQKSALARGLKHRSSGTELVETKSLYIGAKNRLTLVNLILEREPTISLKTVEDIIDESFFKIIFQILQAIEQVLLPQRRIRSKVYLNNYLQIRTIAIVQYPRVSKISSQISRRYLKP